MASTQHDVEFPYREGEGTKPLRPGGAEADDTPDLDPGFNWLFVGLGVVLAIGIVIGLWQMGTTPADPAQLNLRELAPEIQPTR